MPRKKTRRRLTHRKVGDLHHYRIGDDYEVVQGKDYDTLRWGDDKLLIPRPDTLKSLGLGAAGAKFFLHLRKGKPSPMLFSHIPVSGEQLEGIATGASASTGFTIKPQTITMFTSCPNCGRPLSSPTNYCPNCGNKL